MANDFQNILSCAFKFQTLKRKQKKEEKEEHERKRLVCDWKSSCVNKFSDFFYL